MRGKQRGVAVLLLALVLMVGFAAFLYARLGKWGDATTTARKVNGEVLQQAKAALIGFVAKEVLDVDPTSNPYRDFPGRLPCPESPGVAGTASEGIGAGTCSPTFASNKTVGRLPWRTLGLDKLVDASSEPLWYAVSSNWTFDSNPPPATKMINVGTATAATGNLTFDGTNNVVAVIFAPGRPLVTNPTAAQIAAGCSARNQSRSDRSHVPTGGNPDYRDYLECQNASSPVDDTFGVSVIDNATNEVLNDQAIVITASELLNAMQGPLAERLQRTVAPLLSEHADKWIAAAGGKFLPYAVSFASPPSPETTTVTCGTANVREGVLPTALTTTPGCSSAWGNFSITGTGNSVFYQGCSGAALITCTFQYYTLNALGALLNFLLNLLGLSALVGNVGNTGAITATISADAPNAAVSFRDPLADASIVINPALSHTMSLTPKATGEVSLAIQIPITSGANDLCTSLVGLVCNLLPGALATAHTVTVQFPQLADATVAGAQLAPAVFPSPHTLGLLTPVGGDPHYWLIRNQWYRYIYYAVAPTTSAARSGGFLTVSGFPAANGNSNDKTFVLTLVGPAVTGQTSRPSTSVAQYLEGANASTGDNTFAYQVFSISGNDRVAACPFTSASAVCD